MPFQKWGREVHIKRIQELFFSFVGERYHFQQVSGSSYYSVLASGSRDWTICSMIHHTLYKNISEICFLMLSSRQRNWELCVTQNHLDVKGSWKIEVSVIIEVINIGIAYFDCLLVCLSHPLRFQHSLMEEILYSNIYYIVYITYIQYMYM